MKDYNKSIWDSENNFFKKWSNLQDIDTLIHQQTFNCNNQKQTKTSFTYQYACAQPSLWLHMLMNVDPCMVNYELHGDLIATYQTTIDWQFSRHSRFSVTSISDKVEIKKLQISRQAQFLGSSSSPDCFALRRSCVWLEGVRRTSTAYAHSIILTL